MVDRVKLESAPAGDERVAELERKVEDLGRMVAELGRRLEMFESHRPGAPARATSRPPVEDMGASPPPAAAAAMAVASAAAAATAAVVAADRPAPAVPGPSLATLVGRTLIVLGGAFLLRALTQGSWNSGDSMVGELGVGLGIAYAAVWLLLAHRAGKAGRIDDASAHGLATAAIAFPLLWEATTRFEVLSPPVAAAAVGGFGAALLAAAWRHHLRLLVWFGTGAALATGSLLFLSVEAEWSLLGVVLALAVAALWLAEQRGWPELHLPVAGVLDLLVLAVLAIGGHRGYEWLDPQAMAIVLLAIAGLFLLSFAATTLIARSPAGVLEIVQLLAVVALGYGGAAWTLQDSPLAVRALAAAAAAVGGLCFAATFLVLERRSGHGVTVAGYTAIGALLVVLSLPGLVPLPVCAMLWAGLALAAAWPAAAERRWALRIGVALAVLAAAIASGLVAAAARAFMEPGAAAFPSAAYLVLLLAVPTYVAMQRTAPPASTALKTLSFELPGLAVTLAASAGAAAALVLAVGPLIAGDAEEPDLGALAALRTIVMAVATLLLALAARAWRRPELTWATYLLLGLAPIRIVVDDLPNGRPATLFVTLAAFGGAIILAPWLIRKGGRPPTSP